MKWEDFIIPFDFFIVVIFQDSQNSPTLEPAIHNTIPEFITYNRYKELEKKERERIRLERKQKEEEWEKELATAMGAANVDTEADDQKTQCATRSQDGCDILANSDIYRGFGRVHSISDDCCVKYDEKTSDRMGDFKNSKSEKTANSLEEESAQGCDNSKGCGKVKFGSESDFMNIKKKSSKVSIERGIFSFKEKSSTGRLKKSFSRASSLKTSGKGDEETVDEDYAKMTDVSSKLRDFSDDVKSRIAKSPKLKHSKPSNESQRSTTFMADTGYQKIKNEVVKNYQASLNSSLKDNDNG